VSGRALSRLLSGYVLLLGLACAGLWSALHLDATGAPSETRIVSLWRGGQRFAREVVQDEASVGLMKCKRGCTRIVERIVDSAPLPGSPAILFAISVVAGRDGIEARLGDKTVYLTPDDLLAQQAARGGAKHESRELRMGLNDPESVLDGLASELGTDRATLLERGSLRRFIVRREDAVAKTWPLPAAEVDLSAERLRQAISGGAAYLARNQAEDGRFAYELDATSGALTDDYNWPRHGGATLLLAEVGHELGDRAATDAALRASRLVRDTFTQSCGEHRCIGEGTRIDAGSAALALLAYSELTLSGASDEFRGEVAALSAFLRSLQRPDGEFKHIFDRETGRALDVQMAYYTGEIVLALGRAARITAAQQNLRAASAGLSRLTRRTLFQSRYTYVPEHWTCQALDELWERAPDPAALEFCLDHQTYNRQYQFRADNPLGDYGGGIASNPFSPPRFAPTGSRAEGAVATLSAALAARVSRARLASLEEQVRGSLAYMLRYQLQPGPAHLMRDPARVRGAWPGSPIDLSVRIDYPQHVAGAMLRYLRLLADGRVSIAHAQRPR